MKAAILSAALLTLVAHGTASADSEPTEDTVTAADEAGVDLTSLLGAMSTTGMDARTYLARAGELPQNPDAATPGWPIGGALGARLYCIEGMESAHGRYMYNSTPVGREHAQGWLGFLPSTAGVWGAVIGNRSSEWSAAARMLQAGAGRQFAGVAWGRC